MLEVFKQKRVILVFLLYVGLIGWLVLTNPNNLPLPLLIVPFLLIFTALFLSLRLIIERYFNNLGKRSKAGVALALSGIPVLLLVLQSIGQLSLSDLLIAASLIIGLVFYFRKTDFI